VNLKLLEKMLRQHEGVENKPYFCPANKLTIGVGRNLEDKGLSDSEVSFLLQNDIEEVINDLGNLIRDFGTLPENIKLVLSDMRFNLGPNRFRGFKNMLAAVEARDWKTMVAEMKDSRWYRQVGKRAETLILLVNEVNRNG